jgi:hypothetical protein
MNTVKTVAIGILLTALVISSVLLGMLLLQNMQDAEQLKIEVSQIQRLLSTKPEESQKVVEGLEKCEGGELRYHSIYTTLTFCYPTKMGAVLEKETGISPEAREGTRYHFNFDRDDNLRIDLQTANFAMTGDRDVPDEVSFSCIDFNKSDEELKECFFDEVVSMERLVINDLKALLVTLAIGSMENPETTIEVTRLVVPDILEQPKMDAVVILDAERAVEVQKIIESVE